MELREPPRPSMPPAVDKTARALLVAQLVGLVVLGILGWQRGNVSSGEKNPHRREVAAKLKAAGALDGASELYAEVMADGSLPAEERAALALSLGTMVLDAGRPEEALRWFYEAEALGPGKLASAVAEKIVHALERLGRVHQAQAALAGGVGLAGPANSGPNGANDPVVATLSGEPFYRSQVEARLGELPPEMAAEFAAPEKRGEALKQVVASELLWRKAQKLEIPKDPKVLARVAELSRQIVVGQLVEREILAKIAVDEVDLRSFFTANQARYAPPSADGKATAPPELAAVRQAVERDYRMAKAQAAYQAMIEAQLGAADVKLFPERMADGEK